MKRLTITIGIPAYNEEKNIALLLKDIFSQNLTTGVLKNVIVLSDQSTDHTDDIVESFKRATLMKNTKRLGKSGSVKKLFAKTKGKTDITIVIDADTRLANNDTIEKLIRPLSDNKQVFVVSGRVTPRKPSRFVEKIGYFNTKLFDEIIKSSTKNTDYYLCSDQLVAIRNNQLNLSDLQAEYMYDEFYFLLAMKKKLTFVSAADAVSYYQLPATVRDYLKQMIRFLSSPGNSEANFGEAFVSQYQTITGGDKMKTLGKLFFKEPHVSTVYFALQAYARAARLFSNKNVSAVWAPVSSTK